MSGYYSPERLDIVVDNPGLTFPKNVEYHFMLETHKPERQPVAVEMVKRCDVYAPEFPDAYPLMDQKEIRRAFSIASHVMSGNVTTEDNEWFQTFEFSPNTNMVEDCKDTRKYMDFCQEISTYRNSGIIFRPIDTISPDPESREMLWPHGEILQYAPNPFWMLSTTPIRDSLMLRQLASIGWEQSSERMMTRIGVTCGALHWPIAVAARYMGAHVTKSYTNREAKEYSFAMPLLPYYRERFNGEPVRDPVCFLRNIYRSYKEVINGPDFNSVLPLIEDA